MTKPDAMQDGALASLGDQVQSLLDASGMDAVGFVLMVDVGGGVVGFESRSRIANEQFASLLARRAAAM